MNRSKRPTGARRTCFLCERSKVLVDFCEVLVFLSDTAPTRTLVCPTCYRTVRDSNGLTVELLGGRARVTLVPDP